MSERVVDSSFLIAILRNERIDRVSIDVVDGAIISTVNLSEVFSKAIERNVELERVEALLSRLSRVEPFTAEQARIAAGLRARTIRQGMGLGDRACIALGLELDADVYTAEHKWTEVDLGCRIMLIRALNPQEPADSVQ